MELGCTTSTSIVNPDLGDIALSDTGLEVLHTDLAAEVAQRLHVRMKFYKGEWFLDLNQGAPYYQLILQKGVKDVVIRAVFGAIIRTTEGVSELTRLSYSISRDRQLSLSFVARLKDGTTFRSTDYPPYTLAV